MRIEARNIGFYYQEDDWILNDFSFEWTNEQIIGISGSSGVGKSTLSKILANYLTPQAGKVTIDGKSVRAFTYFPVQLIFQHPEKAVNSRWKIKKIIEEVWLPDELLLYRLGIKKEWYHRYPNELSGGELQRVCIARALGPKTKFLIADEMTTMLDAITQAQIWNTVIDICEQRKIGLLVISHDRHLMEKITENIVYIN